MKDNNLKQLRYLRKRAIGNMCTQRYKISIGASVRVRPEFWEQVANDYTQQIRDILMIGYEWADIPGIPYYKASRLGGKIFSEYQNIILGATLDEDDYLQVGISIDGKEYKRKVHRLVALAFHKNPKNKPQVNHLDFDKSNNDAPNLAWATSQEDADHKVAANRQAKGSVFPPRKGRKLNLKTKKQTK